MPSTKKYTPEPGRIVVVETIPNCDFCHQLLGEIEPGPYDFSTGRVWAHGCQFHWEQYRVGPLGAGSGQLWITKDQVAPEDLRSAELREHHKREL